MEVLVNYAVSNLGMNVSLICMRVAIVSRSLVRDLVVRSRMMDILDVVVMAEVVEFFRDYVMFTEYMVSFIVSWDMLGNRCRFLELNGMALDMRS